MKKLQSILLFLFVSVTGFSQSWTETIEISGGIPPLENLSGFTEADLEHLRGNWLEWSKIIGVLGEFDDIALGQKGILGSVMFFKKEDSGRLYAQGKVYKVDNINDNIKTNQFQTRMENDSIFIYHMEGLKRVVINDTDFSVLYNPRENREKIYEVVQSGKRVSLVKDHTIKYQEASLNPMVNRRQSKFIKKWKYYTVDYKNRIVPFKAKRKFLMRILQDEDRKEKMSEFLSENEIDLKNENDLKWVFKYLNTM